MLKLDAQLLTKGRPVVLFVTGELGPVGDLHVSWLYSELSPGLLDLLPSLWTYLTPLLISGTLSPWPRHPGPPSPAPTVHHITEPFYNLSLTTVSQGMYEISVVPINAYGSSSQSVKLPLYLRAPAGTEELCNVHPNTTQMGRFYTRISKTISKEHNTAIWICTEMVFFL